jgi:hypothetical protein
MKRVLIALLAVLPLAVGVAGAQADGLPDWPGGGGASSQVAVAGTVVSVNAGAGSFVADAYVQTPPSMPGSGTGFPFAGFGGFGGFGDDAVARDLPAPPTTTQVTITTNSSTTLHIAGASGTPSVGGLAPGDHFVALFPGAPTDTIQTLVANPASAVFAQVPRQFYAFVGTVTATSTTANTVTVDVMRSLPSSLIASGTSATFTVSPMTFIIGGASLSGHGFGGLFGGSLSAVASGDMVTGGLIAPAGLTATQVEAMPLMFMLDLPAPTGTSSSTTQSAANRALADTMRILHGGKVKLSKKHSRRHTKSHSRHAARH